ncbi:hypothetical protein [Phocaeicola dorei]|nr:hypothetical protein [Phocaeicola dorei]
MVHKSSGFLPVLAPLLRSHQKPAFAPFTSGEFSGEFTPVLVVLLFVREE